MKIYNRFTKKIIFECKVKTIKEAVELAVMKGISLSEANLIGANLYKANLSGIKTKENK